MLRVFELRELSDGAPTQWQGLDPDGNPVYVRYSHGHLSVSVGAKGDSIFSAVYGTVAFEKQVGSEESSEITLDQLKTSTVGVIEWTDQEF